MLVIDAQRLVTEPHTSGATYLSNLLKHPPKEDLALLIPFHPPEGSPHGPLLSRFRTVVPSSPLDPSASIKVQTRWTQVVIPDLIRRAEGHTYFSPYHFTPINTRVKVVTTIHDLCYQLTGRWSRSGLIHRGYVKSALIKARNLICVSEFTRRQLARESRRGAAKATVVLHGIDNPTLDPSEAEAIVRQLGVTPPFLLWIGYPAPRKNPDLVARAAEHLKIPLVAVIPSGSDFPSADIRLTGITERQRDALLRCSAVLLFPSVCEGFGFPVLEAMRQGCPPLALRGTVAEELTGGLIDHPDSRHYGESVARYIVERKAIERALIERSQEFSVEKMAQKTWSVICSG